MCYLISAGKISIKDLIEEISTIGNFEKSDFIIDDINVFYNSFSSTKNDYIFKIKENEPLISKDHSLLILSTGSNENWKINNIYDLFGNISTYTLEKNLKCEATMIERGGKESNCKFNRRCFHHFMHFCKRIWI